MSADTQNTAGLVASTLKFLSQETSNFAAPFNMWTPQISLDHILELSEQVGRGEAWPLWVEEEQPTQGLALYAPSPWESNIFGFGCARCFGPFLKGGDQEQRERWGRQLARRSAEMAQSLGHQLITAKVYHDPAVLRGFLAENFILAEIGASLVGYIPEEMPPPTCPLGFSFLAPSEIPAELSQQIIDSLGDFFYDGHYRHDSIPGPQASQKLWAQVLQDDLSEKANPKVVLWDQVHGQVAGVATVRRYHQEAVLNILTVSEAYRQRGFGRLIMQETIHRLAGHALRLRVETASYNLGALRLYHGLGFRDTTPLVALHYHGPKVDPSLVTM